ncbi:MAG: hypothetical protein HZA13_02285 [Nitrospirae bacterium]|nr:hypothetical protein [Nitrospirota bacterium]
MGARAVQLLLRCPHTPRLHRQSRMLASALPVEGDGRSPAEGSSQRADASVEGEAPKALPLEGATQAPLERLI